MPQMELSAGVIDYDDLGAGPLVVLTHGLIMDGTVWRNVVADLRQDHRCVTPTLPLGAHRTAMRPDADLSLRRQARLFAEFLDKLDLRDATLVVNDWGGPILTVPERPERIARLALTSCEAFDNIPPGLPGRFAGLSMSPPGGVWLAAQLLRLRVLRRLPFTFGWMSRRPVPDRIFDGWLVPCQTDPGVRRDLRKYVTDRNCVQDLMEATERLRGFDRPALIAWAAEDRIMPRSHARSLAQLLPKSSSSKSPTVTR
jgi:pimeloyl-ACP methyl ester carboxylesterase